MPDTPSITLVKRFLYRGNQEEWSNTYHFAGTAPSNAAAWKTMADALIAQEKTFLLNTHSYVRAYGYDAGNEHSVAQIDYVALGGTLVVGANAPTANGVTPGDAAFMLRAKVGTSSRGKSVYIRKYYHGINVPAGGGDSVGPTQQGQLQTFGNLICTTGGPLPGGWCAPQGALGSNPLAMPFITTRTLKRRGKRP